MEFVQTAAAAALYEPRGVGSAAAGLLYLLPPGAASAPATIGFADSWEAWEGAYLFLRAPLDPGTEAAFAAAAAAWLADPRMLGVRFVWFDPPDLPGLLSGTPLAVFRPTGVGQSATAFRAELRFGGLSLVIPAGTSVSADAAACSFSFTNAARPIHMTAGRGAAAIDTLAPAATLPLEGPFAGCLQFSLEATVANLADLGAGLRFYYAEDLYAGAPDSSDPPAAAPDYFLASLHYPLLAAPVSLYAALDPLSPLDPERSLFAFAAADSGQPAGPAPTPVTSCYRSTLGDVLSLQPLTGAAAPRRFASLVFAVDPQAVAGGAEGAGAEGPRDSLYLVPSGDFALSDPGAGRSLMCGLSSVEYFTSAAILSFEPGSEAFAAGFSPRAGAGYPTVPPASPPTTSYAAVRSGSGGSSLQFYAQPDRSVLHNFGAGAGSATMLAPVQVLAATPGEESAPVPLLPYAGVGGTADLYTRMETQIVSPLRRSLLGSAPPILAAAAAGAGPSAYSTTPQGLLATYVAGRPVWDEIVLGQTGDPPQMLRLSEVRADLLSAFQRNQLFLVISDPEKIAPYLKTTDAQVVLGSSEEPWNFNLDPAQGAGGSGGPVWTELGTILIVKFSRMSIADLARQPGSWAFPAEFNADARATSAAIAEVVSDAKSRLAGGDRDFTAFVAAVSDPEWNGILALSVDAPIDNLPPQLAGLAAGIDQSRFYGHHIGIEQSKIVASADPPALGIDNSSVFGLIHYTAPAPLPRGAGDFAFQVEQLKVLFENSQVAGFSATIALEVNSLFGEPATLQAAGGGAAPSNIVELHGVYHRQVVGGVAHESYSFGTADGAASVFDMTSPTLNAVELARGQFVTVTQPWPLATVQRTVDGNVVTVSAALAANAVHTLAVGDFVILSEVADQSFDGLYRVTAVPSQTRFIGQPAAAESQAAGQSSGGEARPTKTDSRFLFWGLIDFAALPGLDLFSFGREAPGDPPSGLSFSNLAVEMTFDSAADPPVPQFELDASKLAFDPAASTARAASLFSHFPLTVAGFTQAKAGSAPTDLGFMGVQTPLDQASLTFPWYSLDFNLDLGSPGGLAAKTGFVATLTAAWSPAGGGPNASYSVFTGLRLPGSSGGSREISLQGIFNITFKTLEILLPPDSTGTFILVLYDIRFKFLSLGFPPSGQVNFVLFGDPAAPGGNTSLGWYAAYAKAGGGSGGSGAGGSGAGGDGGLGLAAAGAAALGQTNHGEA